jgi:ribosomal subunit interface protein
MAINFQIKTKNLDLTPKITNYIHEKLNVIEKFISSEGDKEILAKIDIGLRSRHHQKGDVYKAEANVNHEGKSYNATALGSTIEEAVDKLRDEIGRVIKRKKNKNIDIGRAGGRLFKKILRK